MDVPAVKQGRVSTTMQTARKTLGTVDVGRVIPQELMTPAAEKTSVRERVRQFEKSGGVSRTRDKARRGTRGSASRAAGRHHVGNERREGRALASEGLGRSSGARERCAEVKMEVAARLLDWMEHEKDEVDDAEDAADLQEALTNHTKVVGLVVDTWFVDKG